MKKKSKTKGSVFLVLSIILLIGSLFSLSIPFFGIQETALFFEKSDSGWVVPSNTNLIEENLLTLKTTSSAPRDASQVGGNIGGISAYAIWIDGKKYSCNAGRGVWSDSNGNYANHFTCSDKLTVCEVNNPRYGCQKYMDVYPDWGFVFGQPELPSGVQVTDKSIAEGWVGIETRDWQGNSQLSKAYFRFEFSVSPLPCTLDTGQGMSVGYWGTGATFDKSVLSNFVKFCSIIPPEIIDAKTMTIPLTDYSIITKLENNQKITVPDGEIIGIRWISTNECPKDLAYNQNANQCLNPQVVVWCPNGNWVDGTCVTTTVVGCQNNDDCKIPCKGVTSECIQEGLIKKCSWEGSCENLETTKIEFRNKYIEVDKIVKQEVIVEVKQNNWDFIKENIWYILSITLGFLSLMSFIIWLIFRKVRR